MTIVMVVSIDRLIFLILILVLATFVEGLANFHNHHYGTQLTLADFSSYEFVEVWGGSQEDTAKKVLHFFETDFFLQLGTVPKAYEVMLTNYKPLFRITFGFPPIGSRTLK
jgi:hypothetical protein